MLKINNLTKHYDGTDRDVTDFLLHVEAGDPYALSATTVQARPRRSAALRGRLRRSYSVHLLP